MEQSQLYFHRIHNVYFFFLNEQTDDFNVENVETYSS